VGTFHVRLPWGTTEIDSGTTAGEVLLGGPAQAGEIVAALVNCRIVGLDFPLEAPSLLEPVLASSLEGEEVVRRTATLLLHAVCRRLYPKARLQVGQSLRGGYHYTVTGEHPPLEEMAKALTAAFQAEAEAGRQIARQDVNIDAATLLFLVEHPEKAELLRVWPTHRVPLVRCLDFTDIRHGAYPFNARCVAGFHVEAYAPGLILAFEAAHETRGEGNGQGSVLFRTYSETRRWNETVGISTVADLNTHALDDSIRQVVQIAEGQHEKKIAELADRIAARRDECRVVCIAGPSSSGKTTFVKRLSIQLQVNGITPSALSLDDYYVNRLDTPRDADGELDYEALEAIDLSLFRAQLADLVLGRQVLTPVYDFKTGERKSEPSWRPRELRDDEVLLIEGIHGLNPALTDGIPETARFRIFINALTQLSIDHHNRIRTSDSRLLRRIVRDRRYRNIRAAETIRRWPKVRAGEEKHIFPFQENCDAMFNSALAYETAVLKNFAERYLLEIPADSPSQAKGYQLRRFLDLFVPLWPDHVPHISILREFIGGSDFSYK
jgi:uridine kinase